MSSISSIRPLSSNIGLLHMASVLTIDKKWEVRGTLSIGQTPPRESGAEPWPTFATFPTEIEAWNFMVTFAEVWSSLEYIVQI